jgi:tetratricopeptide (TPR) repeat protein
MVLTSNSKVIRIMARKTKQSKRRKKVTAVSSQFDKWLDLIGHQIFHENYAEAVANCERVLNFLPMRPSQRADVLAQLGTAQGMLQNFPQSYEAFSEAIALDPNNADLWYNRSMASRFTIRIGRAFRDVERAIELNTRSELAEQFDEALQFSREMAEMSMKMRGPDFTLDQLVEQEDLFQQGLKLMEAGKWEEAGQAFRASIDLGDCLPQPWGNLGVCLLMQERYDESEAALKRALVIDPTYTIAKDNLARLDETRRIGPPDVIAMTEPFRSSKLKQGITYFRE